MHPNESASYYSQFSPISELMVYSDAFFALLKDLDIDDTTDLSFYTWLVANVFSPRSIMTLTPKDFNNAFARLNAITISDFKKQISNVKSSLVFPLPTVCPHCSSTISSDQALDHIYFKSCSSLPTTQMVQCSSCLSDVKKPLANHIRSCISKNPSFSCPGCQRLLPFDLTSIVSHLESCSHSVLSRVVDLASRDVNLFSEGGDLCSELIDLLSVGDSSAVESLVFIYLFDLCLNHQDKTKDFSSINSHLHKLLNNSLSLDLSLVSCDLYLFDDVIPHCYVTGEVEGQSIVIDSFLSLSKLPNSQSHFELSAVNFSNAILTNNLDFHKYFINQDFSPRVFPTFLAHCNNYSISFSNRDFEHEESMFIFNFKLFCTEAKVVTKVTGNPLLWRVGVETSLNDCHDVVLLTSEDSLDEIRSSESNVCVELFNDDNQKLFSVGIPFL
ncbi:hypothetical protein GEMRC1_004004 [Eukaryota sp. GEM-RC1]